MNVCTCVYARVYVCACSAPTGWGAICACRVIGDQFKRADVLKNLEVSGGNYDVVIDDGGHNSQQQIMSMEILFPAIKPGTHARTHR